MIPYCSKYRSSTKLTLNKFQLGYMFLTFAFSSLIIIAVNPPPLAHVEMAGTGQKKVAGAGWLRAPPRWGMKEVNLAH